MKSTFVFLFSILFLLACNKDNNMGLPDNNNLATGYIKARIDGKLFESDAGLVGASYFDYGAAGSGSWVVIWGWDDLLGDNGKFLYLYNYFPEGTFNTGTFTHEGECTGIDVCSFIGYGEGLDINDDDHEFSAYSNYTDGKMRIKIDELDTTSGGTVKGTFSGTIYDEVSERTLQVTEGKFNVKIQ